MLTMKGEIIYFESMYVHDGYGEQEIEEPEQELDLEAVTIRFFGIVHMLLLGLFVVYVIWMCTTAEDDKTQEVLDRVQLRKFNEGRKAAMARHEARFTSAKGGVRAMEKSKVVRRKAVRKEDERDSMPSDAQSRPLWMPPPSSPIPTPPLHGDQENRALLRDEQDSAFAESLAQDRAKEQAKCAQREAEAMRGAQWEQFPAEPSEDEEEATSNDTLDEGERRVGIAQLVFRLPSGARLGRRFRGLDPIQLVLDFVELCPHIRAELPPSPLPPHAVASAASQASPSPRWDVSLSYPSRSLRDMPLSCSLIDAGLVPSAVLLLSPRLADDDDR